MKKDQPENPKKPLKRRGNKQYLFLGITALFLIINSIAIIRGIPAIPLIGACCVLVYLLIFRLDWLIYLMAFTTPFSIIFEYRNFNAGLSVPSEIIMIALTLLFVCRILYDLRIDKKIAAHPVSIAIYIYLLWMLITCITSELPTVSFKFLASKIWFTTACYWVVAQFIRADTQKALRYFNCYAIGLAAVVIITTCKHGMIGFNLDNQYSNHVMQPFYNDHTAYGAVLAFFLPFTAACFFLPHNNRKRKFFYAALTVLFLSAFYLSFSRAAWISLFAAICVWVVLLLRIKLPWLLAGGILIGAILFIYADDILHKMNRNTQETSENFVEQLQSISNISTDASNVERINRWVAACAMIEEKPVTGHGPGTYQFKYAPYQRSRFHTVISTNLGTGGNAHSEYIGPCVESGIPGMLTVFGLLFCSLVTGIRTFRHTQDKTDRLLCLMMTLSLVTYFVHGTLNNFLDTDKLSLPFWGAFAVIMVLNVKMKESSQSQSPA